MRGKRDVEVPDEDVDGLIPACAGKTETQAYIQRITAAHPRVCGENKYSGNTSGRPHGSSPRVRGKLSGVPAEYRTDGLIPACAGKTSEAEGCRRPSTAHPRVCGENFFNQCSNALSRGSSPRVRGKPGCARALIERDGLIPACAGKTRIRAHRSQQRRAHPRVCGENSPLTLSVLQTEGSSPRVRGKQNVGIWESSGAGLIPACAGKTVPIQSPSLSPPAHPRVCGENMVISWRLLSLRGSSPRVRGKPLRCGSGTGSRRLIPACAGKTRYELACTHENGAHPRVCGENFSRGATVTAPPGSSPRVRGKRTLGTNGNHEGGLIPACAGKTRSARRSFYHGTAHPRVCGENRRSETRCY